MDRIFASWLERQRRDALELSAASDHLTIDPEPGMRPASRFIAQFSAPTMVRTNDEVRRIEAFTVLIQFPPSFLRSAHDAGQIVNVIEPNQVWHPNVMGPFICLGHIAPGTGLIELIFQVYEILTFQKLTPREDDALNHNACVWARQHMAEFPLSAAPLSRRANEWSIHEIAPRQTSLERGRDRV